EWIKLEVNDHATPFIPRSYGEELAMCKRYYEAGDISFAVAKGVVYEPLSKFSVEKRITPTLTYQAPTDVNNIPIPQTVGATYPRTTTVGAIELNSVAQYPIINIKYTADAEI
ncbi:hypothetical protein, partial [Anaerocolumna jejuensis]|uniref:hypothetical protein n=1 Tax=Anaerocolumna jejuensis TaxID=259063 RepID=UPI003F7B8C96